MQVNLDSIFKNAKEITSEISQGSSVRSHVLRFLLIIFACGGIYGATMGLSHSWQQALSSAVKVPLLYLLTLLICIPTLHFIGLFLGSRITFLQSASVLLLGMAVNSALLLGFATISIFFFATGSSYRFLLLMHVAVFMIAGFAGLISIRRSFRQLSAQSEMPGIGRVNLLQVWMLLYMFVGTQMAYVLGPFVGKEPEFYMLHHARGNFYSYVWTTISERYGDRIEPEKARDLVSEPAALAIHALKYRDFARLSRFADEERGLKFILESVPRSSYDANLDPQFTPAKLADAAQKNESIPVYTNYNYELNRTETRSISFSELQQHFYSADFAAVVEQARFNEFSKGRENKDKLYAAYPGCIFVEYVVSGEKGTWKALRLVFSSPPGVERTGENWKLVAVIHDQARQEDQAFCKRPFGSGMGRPRARAVSIHSAITTRAFVTASWYVLPSAIHPGSSGTSTMNALSSLLQ